MSQLPYNPRPVATIILILLFSFLLIPYRSIQAATYSVSTCDSAALITAINAANGTAEDDRIVLNGTCTYTLTAVDNISSGSNGLPVIVDAATAGTLTIEGNDATIQRDGAAPNFRIFHLLSGADLTLDRLTISGGRATGTTPTYFGGAIFNWDGTLTITNSTLTDNAAGFGGAIFSGHLPTGNVGAVTISNSTIADNSVTNRGGGIANSDTLTLSSSIVSGNSAIHGGGINNDGTLTIETTTFFENTAAYGGATYNNDGASEGKLALNTSLLTLNDSVYGGAVYNWGGTMTVTNSTLSNNTASYGGAAFNSGIPGNDGTLTLNHSTLYGNSATYGGGVNNEDTVIAINSILAGHTQDDNCLGGITDGGYNIADDDTCGFGNTAGAGVGDNVDPMLKFLADYGGPTWTHSLFQDSPAVNVVPPAACVWDHDNNNGTATVPLTVDQRGVERRDALCDIGAYEIRQPDHFISEREFFAQMQLELANNPASQILDFAVIDFVPEKVNMTLRTVDGTVGEVELSVTDPETGFVIVRIVSITVDGAEPSEAYRQAVNRELPPLIASSLKTLSDQKVGLGSDLDGLWMTDNALAAIFLAP